MVPQAVVEAVKSLATLSHQRILYAAQSCTRLSG